MITSFFKGGNAFTGISKEMLVERISKVKLDDADYPFAYSNFGFATLGAVLEKIYDKDYTLLINEYISEELRLENTRSSDGTGDLKGYWQWIETDVYKPAGALLSNITGMMQYAELHMSGNLDYLYMSHDALAEVTTSTSESYEKLGIRIDAVGASG